MAPLVSEWQLLLRDKPGTMSSPQTVFPNSIPRQHSTDILCDSDSVGTRNDGESVEDSSQYEERFRVDRKKLEQMLHGELVVS